MMENTICTDLPSHGFESLPCLHQDPIFLENIGSWYLGSYILENIGSWISKIVFLSFSEIFSVFSTFLLYFVNKTIYKYSFANFSILMRGSDLNTTMCGWC